MSRATSSKPTRASASQASAASPASTGAAADDKPATKKREHTKKKHSVSSIEKRATSARASGGQEAPATDGRADDAGPAVAASAAEYKKYLGVARAYKGVVQPMRANLHLVRHNAKVGVASVLDELQRTGKTLPEINSAELAELPDIVYATIHADTQILRKAQATNVPEKIARGFAVRGQLLKTADALAENGLLPRERVDQIAEGKGPVDMATDNIALSALFTDNAAAIAGKHPITPAQLVEADALGKELLDLLRPTRERNGPTAINKATDDRDRLWTLVVQRHDKLWRAGAFLFGRDVDARVPALMAGKRRKGAAAETEAVTESQGDTITTAGPKPAGSSAPTTVH